MYQDIFVYQDCVTYTCFRYQKRKSYVTDWLERGEWDQLPFCDDAKLWRSRKGEENKWTHHTGALN